MPSVSAALLPANPFVNMPHVLDDARAELLAAQAELHRARQKRGKRTWTKVATTRLYKALDAVHAAQENG